MNKKKLSMYILITVGFALIVAVIAKLVIGSGNIQQISYKEFIDLVNDGKIDTVFYNEESEYMTVVLFNDETCTMSETERMSYSYKNDDCRRVVFPDNEDFKVELLEKGVLVRKGGVTLAEFAKNYGEFLLYLILLFTMLFFVSKSTPLSDKSFATDGGTTDVTFDDVIGHEEVKKDLQLLVKQLKNGAKVKDLSHGVLFEGGAGTGKTMLAKAVANEAGVNFISVNSSSLVEMYVGLGAKRVREAFKKAREKSPCVLFFDEIDAVGAKRGSQRSHRENDQTINAFLTELDGFSDKGDILVIAATNRADDLDEALLRSGRFDRKIKIEAPKKWETRQELFEHYLKDKKNGDVDTAALAKQTIGFSGADIAAVCREASLIAFREDAELITHAFLEEAIDKMVFKGNRSSSEQRREDLECVAYHEAGHAVMSRLCGRNVSRISIMGMTSGVGGAVFQCDNDRYFETKEEIVNQIMIAYAGRASEEIHYGANKITQGASNDITQATKLLSAYVTKYGFDEQFGLVDYEIIANTVLTDSGVTARISNLSNDFYKKTIELLSNNYNSVERLAIKLLEVKTLSGEETEEILKGEHYEQQQNDCN